MIQEDKSKERKRKKEEGVEKGKQNNNKKAEDGKKARRLVQNQQDLLVSDKSTMTTPYANRPIATCRAGLQAQYVCHFCVICLCSASTA